VLRDRHVCALMLGGVSSCSLWRWAALRWSRSSLLRLMRPLQSGTVARTLQGGTPANTGGQASRLEGSLPEAEARHLSYS
jgi:hypothetical protein